MANKCTKMCSTSLAITVLKVKNHKMPPNPHEDICNQKDRTGFVEDTEKLELHTLLVGILNGADTLGNSLALLSEVNIELLHDPAILFLGTYPGEIKPCICTKTFR